MKPYRFLLTFSPSGPGLIFELRASSTLRLLSSPALLNHVCNRTPTRTPISSRFAEMSESVSHVFRGSREAAEPPPSDLAGRPSALSPRYGDRSRSQRRLSRTQATAI